MAEFTLDESRLAEVADRYQIETDDDAVLALEAVILSDDYGGPLLSAPCGIGIDRLADVDGQADGYRVLVHPDADEAAPWLASEFQCVNFQREAGRDTAGIIRDFVRIANNLLAWYNERLRTTNERGS